VKVALDTNVLVYAEGINGPEKKIAAIDLLRKLPVGSAVLPAQTLGELFNVLVRKGGRSQLGAQTTILGWSDAFPVIATSPEVVISAVNLASDHQLGMWEAVIMAASARAGCRLLLSEDLQDGFTWSGLTVTNPFSPAPHVLLAALING
jgi:predicted nucleic acid-binding protein